MRAYKVLLALVATLATIPVALTVLAYLLQDALLFHPTPRPDSVPQAPAGWRSEPLSIAGAGLEVLSGWLLLPPGAPAPVVIYFGGNAEDVSQMRTHAGKYGGTALALVNYRGYGGNAGKPGESALFADALRVYDEIARRTDVRSTDILVHGVSLGSGVAVYVAAERAVRGIILTTPYDSVESVAKSHYPFLPVSILLRHRFDSLERAPKVAVPALFLVAGNDKVIPPAHAQRLFDVWLGPKSWFLFQGRDHNDISESREYWDTIAFFIKNTFGKPS